METGVSSPMLSSNNVMFPLAGDINWMETVNNILSLINTKILIKFPLAGDINWMETTDENFQNQYKRFPLAGDINWMETYEHPQYVVTKLCTGSHSLGTLIEWKLAKKIQQRSN